MIYAVIAILVLVAGAIVAVYLRGRSSAQSEAERDNALVEVAERDAQLDAIRAFERERERARAAADAARDRSSTDAGSIRAAFGWLRRRDPRRSTKTTSPDVADDDGISR